MTTEYAALALKAREFAKSMHANQKYGTEPYVVHLELVRTILLESHYERIYEVAAWLHDMLEDTHVTVELMNALFGAQVTTLVWAVTGTGGNRKERNESIYEKLAIVPAAIPLKLADRIANVTCAREDAKTSLFTMYRDEHAEFVKRLAPYSLGCTMWERLQSEITAHGRISL